jgi:hypothetical protein
MESRIWSRIGTNTVAIHKSLSKFTDFLSNGIGFDSEPYPQQQTKIPTDSSYLREERFTDGVELLQLLVGGSVHLAGTGLGGGEAFASSRRPGGRTRRRLLLAPWS